MSEGKSTDANQRDWMWFIVPAIVAISVWLFAPSLWGKSWTDLTVDGVFVAVGTLFSGLAFAGVIVAIVLQRRELQLQRQELRETREEFEHQTEQLRQQNKTLREANTYEILTKLLFEYRSPEMLLAIEKLWAFYERHPHDFVKVYEDHYRETYESITRPSSSGKVEDTRASLHYQRRLVSQFYNLLSGLYEAGVIPADVLYSYWGEQDLRILPKILIPIEIGIRHRLSTSTEPDLTLRRLQRLYDDNPGKSVEA